MKPRLMAAVSAVTFAVAGVAHAHTINWGQWGLGTFGGTLTGVTMDGLGFTITSPNGVFYVIQQGSPWLGIFDTGDPVLWDGDGPGDDHIVFDSPISSLTVALQSNAYGTFNEYMFSYDASDTLVDHPVVFDLTSQFAPGTFVSFTTSADGIVAIDLSTSNDFAGIGVGGGSLISVPEPSTWAMLALGFAGLGFASWGKTKRAAAVAA